MDDVDFVDRVDSIGVTRDDYRYQPLVIKHS